MELISTQGWSYFYNPRDLRRAKTRLLEEIALTLPWIAAVDEFQHWLYTHPEHSHDDGFLTTGGLLLNGQLVTLPTIKKLLSKDDAKIVTPEGLEVYLSNDIIEKLRPILYFGREEDGGLKLSRHHFQLVDDTLEVGKEELAKLKSFDRLPNIVAKTLPVGLNATMDVGR